MQSANCSFTELPFSELFQTYISNFEALNDFYQTNPFNEQAVAGAIDDFSFNGDREKTARLLHKFNEGFNVNQSALDNIERLRDDKSLAVVTGQQLGVYGGPLYTVFKIITVIHKARQLEARHNRPVIPVFWMADEDHDFEEIRSLSVLKNDENEAQQFSLSPKESDDISPVADIKLGDDVNTLRDNLRNELYDTDFTDDLWQLLDSHFKPGCSFREAFGGFISTLFSKHGLVLAGSHDPQIKEATKSYLLKSVTHADEIRESLEEKSEALNKDYHRQVTLYDSNLFYLDDESGRSKISRNEQHWETDSGKSWDNDDELLTHIDEQPQQFSPNVFLRPILQDALLPTIEYIAGPGETAYYGQMKSMYTCFDLEMPIIAPRLSATIIEPAIDRIMNELPFDFHQYAGRIEDLESAFAKQAEQHDLESLFSDWKKQVEQLTYPKKETIADIDPTLEDTVEKANARYYNQLDKLKGKVYRSIKSREDTQLKRIRRIKANLFPDGELQERLVSVIFYMNKYGVDIWDDLLEQLTEDEIFSQHKLLYL